MNPDLINYSIGIFGLVLGIVGIVLTIRSVKKKEPIYSIKSNNVITDFSSTYQDLAVSYKKKKVKNFTVSKTLFYNRGSEVINRDDIVNIEPLRVIAKDKVEILDATILQANKDANQFAINFDKQNNQVLIDFEYLYRNQGAVIQVVHTGLSSEDLEIKGEIKDIQIIRRLKFSQEENLKSSNIRRVFIIVAFLTLVVLSVMMLSVSLWGIFSLDEANKFLQSTGNEPMTISEAIVGVFAGIFIILLVARSDVLGMMNVLPNGLEQFHE